MQVLQIPIVIKQKKSMAQTTALQPEQEKIRKMYANNQEKQNEEIQKLQSESGYSMFSGCLPMLIQLPIIWGLFDVIYRPLHYILRLPATVIAAGVGIANSITPGLIAEGNRYKELLLLGAVQGDPNAFISLGSEVVNTITSLDPVIFGVNLVENPAMGQMSMLFPIGAAVLSLLQTIYSQHLTKKASIANGIKPNNMSFLMVLMSPVILVFMGFNLPVGINFYWGIRSVFYLIQEWLLDLIMPQAKLVKDAMEKMKENRKKAQVNKKKTVISEDGKEVTVNEKTSSSKKLSAARKEDEEKYAVKYTDEELQAKIDKLNEARREDAEKYGEVFVPATPKDFGITIEPEKKKK